VIKPGSDRSAPIASRGFTLIELLVTLVVAGIVLSVAVPSFASLLANTRLDGATNTLVSHMTLARSLAVSRGLRIAMCSSADGRTCSRNRDWGSGWIVFVEPERDGDPISESDLIRVQQAAGGGIHLRSSHAYFSYLPDGTLLVR
jgi:type IV fimbrial biogenesis protein FimT